MNESQIVNKLSDYENYNLDIPITDSKFRNYKSFASDIFRLGFSSHESIYMHWFNKKYNTIFLRYNEFFFNMTDAETFKKHYKIGEMNLLMSVIHETFHALLEKYNVDDINYNIHKQLEQWTDLGKDFEATKHFKTHISAIKKYSKKLNKLSYLKTIHEELLNILNHAQDVSKITRTNPEINIDESINKLFKMMKNKNSLINKEGFQNIKEFIIKNEIVETCELIRSEFAQLYNKSVKHVWVAMNFSHLAIPSKLDQNRQLSESIINNKHRIFEINLKNNKKLHFFEDNSVLFENEETYQTIPDNTQIFSYIEEYWNDLLNNKLHKHPYILKKLKSMKTNNSRQFIIDFANYYMENKDIIKAAGFDFISQKTESLENIFDDILKIVNEHKLNKYKNSIISNKYKTLYNDKSLKLFQILMDMKVTESQLQSLIGKKMATFKTPNDLNTALKKQINLFDSFTINAMLEKLKRNNVINHIVQDKILICEIKTYEQSVQLGSSSWCICYSNSLFNEYTENDQKQYFIYDFSKKSNSMLSMIGLTINSKNEYMTAHQKDDTYLEKEEVQKFIKIINEKMIEKTV